jgi:hypothetical protein
MLTSDPSRGEAPRGRPCEPDALRVASLRVPQALINDYSRHSEALAIEPTRLMREALTLYARVLDRRGEARARQVSAAIERGAAFKRRRR